VVFEITTPNNESYKRLQSKRPEQISERPGAGDDTNDAEATAFP
jgi:hypothetical protein